MIKVVKKDGTLEDFNVQKVVDAVNKSACRVLINFTEEEEDIFKLLSRGKSIIEIAEHIMICERTVNRKVIKIKNKIGKLEGLNGKDNC